MYFSKNLDELLIFLIPNSCGDQSKTKFLPLHWDKSNLSTWHLLIAMKGEGRVGHDLTKAPNTVGDLILTYPRPN